MTFANILGLLGLLGIVGLIIIYIIKPNFQQRFVSSTFIWNRSLKYRKRRIPINKLRNLLLIICQVLILVACAMILAKPIIAEGAPEKYEERICIIDASANMKASLNEETRFKKAVKEVKALANELFAEEGGRISVIIADSKARILNYEMLNLEGSLEYMPVQRLTAESSEQLQIALDGLILEGNEKSIYGTGDIEGAVMLAEDILQYNPRAKICLYTGTDYLEYDSSKIEIISMRREGERNVAILNGKAFKNKHGTYTFEVDVAAYGDEDLMLDVTFEINEANESLDKDTGRYVYTDIKYTIPQIACSANQPITVTFDTYEEFFDENNKPEFSEISEKSVLNYDNVRVYISAVNSNPVIDDVLPDDDSFYFYGGRKNKITVHYESTLLNPFVTSIVSAWKSALSSKWEIIATEEKNETSRYATDGYDVYIYEHAQVNSVPSSGLVIYLDPLSLPGNVGLRQDRESAPLVSWLDAYSCEAGSEHPIMKNIVPSHIKMTTYSCLANEGGYEELAYSGGYPVIMYKETESLKSFVMTFSVHYSNLALVVDFPLMMKNLFMQVFPGTIDSYNYEIGQTATFDSIASTMDLKKPGSSTPIVYDTFPATLKLDAPGVYTLSQQKMSGETIFTDFYVKMPARESDIRHNEDALAKIYFEDKSQKADLDLLIYFAAALVALLFAEWWLQSKDQF